MLRTDDAAARGQRRDQHFVHAELLESPCGGDYIDDRIHRADLVEVNLLGRGAMDPGFRLGERAEYRECAFLCVTGERRGARDDLADFAQMALRLTRGDLDLELEGGNSAQHLAPRTHAIAVKRQRGERAPQMIEVGARIEHRTGDHVAAETGKCVEKCRFHMPPYRSAQRENRVYAAACLLNSGA